MKLELIKEIIDCLPQGRTLFPYFDGRYACLLLQWLCRNEQAVSELKKGRYAALLQKPAIKSVLAQHGQGVIASEAFASVWPETYDDFLLTLGCWGGEELRWQQTSRSGYNLVLQVNLHEGYRQRFENVVPEEYRWFFNSYGHPVREPSDSSFYRQTLGWIRLDIDFDTVEVLVEEVQSDWLRDLARFEKFSPHLQHYPDTIEFVQFIRKRLYKIWDEAALSAALWFSVEELGIRKVWYHTFSTGNCVKRIVSSPPPKSIYTTLPRRFCFEETKHAPEFLQRERSYRRRVKTLDAPTWFLLEL